MSVTPVQFTYFMLRRVPRRTTRKRVPPYKMWKLIQARCWWHFLSLRTELWKLGHHNKKVNSYTNENENSNKTFYGRDNIPQSITTASIIARADRTTIKNAGNDINDHEMLKIISWGWRKRPNKIRRVSRHYENHGSPNRIGWKILEP